MGGKKTEYLNIIQANLSLGDSVMAQAVSCWPYAVGGGGGRWARSQASPCEIYGDQNGTVILPYTALNGWLF